MEEELLTEGLVKGILDGMQEAGISFDPELRERVEDLAYSASAFAVQSVGAGPTAGNLEEEHALLQSRAQSLRAAGASAVADYIHEKIQQQALEAVRLLAVALG